jgi:regulator of sigma E protease
MAGRAAAYLVRARRPLTLPVGHASLRNELTLKEIPVSWSFVLSGVVLLGFVIFVHELGHFLMAKWRGVRVLRFSLGFGPAMVSFTRGETEYRLAWFPLGGYVQMAGDHPGEDGSMPAARDEFLSHPWVGRMLIALAGPAANLITAFVTLVVVAMVGVSYPDFPNRLGPTPDSSLAHAAGFREGDRIVAVNATPVDSWVQIFVANSKVPAARPVTLVAEREGRRFEVALSPERREPVMSSLRRPADPARVGAVVTGMPAYKSGLKEGDRILAVDGQPVSAWDELPRALKGKADRPVTLRIERGATRFDVQVTPINPDGGPGGDARIGIEAPRHGVYVERHPFPQALELGFRGTGALVGSVYSSMWLTVSRPLYYREYLGGPLFIAQAAGEQARRGLDSYLQFLAMINVAIMAFNLLPLPLLDGGHVLLALLQAVRRQAISARAYMRFQRVGLVVIGAIFVLILANDPWRLVQRQRALDRAPRENTVAPPP